MTGLVSSEMTASILQQRVNRYVGTDPGDLRCGGSAQRKFNPVYFSQEYSSKERCEAAKSELRRGFAEKVEGLNRILTDKENAGEVRDYERIHVEIICTQK